jgi:xanthine dehydrogenase YagR molybdenum-binding subunit
MTADLRRVDAYEKVTGQAIYGADRLPDGVAHAMFAVATIGRGRITEIDTAAAEAVPAVRLVLTRFTEDELQEAGFVMGGGYAFQSFQPLRGDHIAYRGQPIALVVADTLVAATEAAGLVRARYDTEPFAVTLDAEGATTVMQEEAIPLPFLADIKVGDADAGFAASPVTIDQTYEFPPEHQLPMEFLGGIVEWRGDTLAVYEGTQNAGAVRNGLARQLGIDAARIEVIAPFTGGGFGQKNSLQPHVGPLALAARQLGRPVKLVIPRPQTFHAGSFRPVSRHRVRLGADASGQLRAAIHEVDHQTSRHDLFPASYTDMTARLYGVPAFRGRQRLVQTDVQTPGYMRGPFEGPAAFAFESAIDELAYALGQDPVALRLANDTATDPVTGLPFSTRYLAECLHRGADRFGWPSRNPQPGSMHAADGSMIGMGVAAGAYPCAGPPAVARLSATPDGKITVGVDGHEMGQGIRTAITLFVAEDLGIPVADIIVHVGDTRFAPQHLTAGSWGTATALPAIQAALRELRKNLNVAGSGAVSVAEAVASAGRPSVDVEVSSLGPGQPPEMLDRARAGLVAVSGPVYPDFVTFSWAAHFAEVRIEPSTRQIRVPRIVSVVDCDHVASLVTAASQVRGAVVWGIGAALREESQVDPRFGGFLNNTLEEYQIPVNADIQQIDVDFINEPHFLYNTVGVKGLGEISVVGVPAAIAIAVFHATGRRHRRLPIRLEDVL